MPLPTWLIFALIALAFALAALRKPRPRDQHFSLAARIWLRAAAIFFLAALVLFFLGS